MLRNYLFTSLRALKKDKFYVIVNQLSLALAFALCTIGFFNFMFNHTYNQSFDEYDLIYKINAEPQSATATKDIGTTPLALYDALQSQYPELLTGRFHRERVNLKIGDRFFDESVGYVDDSFLEIVRFSDHSLKLGVDRLILTEKASLRFFGRLDTHGELLEVVFPSGRRQLLTVGEVIKEPHENTSFKFSMFLPMEQYIADRQEKSNNWEAWISGTFVKLKTEDVQKAEVALQRFLPIQNRYNPHLELSSYRLDKITDWPHIERNLYGRSFGVVLHPASVVGTMSSAFAILLLACFNFFNTTIATSGKRLKEISMRKVIGGRRRDIVIQFMMESAIQVVSAFLISLIIAYFLIGSYNAMFRFELVQFQSAYLSAYLTFSVGVCVLTILLSGAYPAFYVSRFKSLDILRKRTKFKGSSWLTKSLLAIQFAVCVYNLFALGVFVENSYYQETLDRGYEVKKFVNVPIKPDRLEQFQNKLTQSFGFELTLGTKDLVGFSNQEISFEYDGVMHAADKLEVGEGYLSGLGVNFLKGGDFEKHRASNERLILINETFNQSMGGKMSGQLITIGEKQYRINGITSDFNLKPIMLSNKIKPTVFFFSPDSLNRYVVVKCDESNLIADNKRIEQLWYESFPEELYGGFYQEKVFESVNHTNQIMVKINSFIALVSILISILGLYALISLTAQRRIKEIGIRKTLGASFHHVLKLLLSEISWMLLFSVILGLMAGQFVINRLLDIIYAYHVEIDLFNFLFALVVILLSAVVSVGYKVIVTARMNPVTQLRVE